MYIPLVWHHNKGCAGTQQVYTLSPAFVCTLPSVVYVCGISSVLLQPFLYVYVFVCYFFIQAPRRTRKSPEFKLSLQRIVLVSLVPIGNVGVMTIQCMSPHLILARLGKVSPVDLSNRLCFITLLDLGKFLKLLNDIRHWDVREI